MKNRTASFWYFICIVGIILIVPVLTFLDNFVAPLLFNSRIERLNEKDLPKASVENGYLYCRMKADDFHLALPPGYRAMTPIITHGGFDSVDGSVELRFDSSNGVSTGCGSWMPSGLQVGASVNFDQSPKGLLIKFHYFGDK